MYIYDRITHLTTWPISQPQGEQQKSFKCVLVTAPLAVDVHYNQQKEKKEKKVD
jgi:hypothetical protein